MTISQMMTQLTQIRKEKGWTQGKLAAESGMHQSGISSYEIGKSTPEFDTIVKLADAMGYDVDVELKKRPTSS